MNPTHLLLSTPSADTPRSPRSFLRVLGRAGVRDGTAQATRRAVFVFTSGLATVPAPTRLAKNWEHSLYQRKDMDGRPSTGGKHGTLFMPQDNRSQNWPWCFWNVPFIALMIYMPDTLIW